MPAVPPDVPQAPHPVRQVAEVPVLPGVVRRIPGDSQSRGALRQGRQNQVGHPDLRGHQDRRGKFVSDASGAALPEPSAGVPRQVPADADAQRSGDCAAGLPE